MNLRRFVFDEEGLSRLLLFYAVLILALGFFLGALVGYAFAAAIYAEEFASELRWHYSPAKINATSIMENQFDRDDRSYLIGGIANETALSGSDREVVGGWNGTAWLRGVPQ